MAACLKTEQNPETKIQPQATSRPPPTEICCWNAHYWTELPKLPVYANVKVLELDDNKLRSLPESMAKHFPVLEELSVARNKLESLPEHFGKLTRLKFVCLAFNRITHLPMSFGNLSDLDYLNMVGNPLNEQLLTLCNPEEDWSPDGCSTFAYFCVALQLALRHGDGQHPTKILSQRSSIFSASPRKPKSLNTISPTPSSRIQPIAAPENVAAAADDAEPAQRENPALTLQELLESELFQSGEFDPTDIYSSNDIRIEASPSFERQLSCMDLTQIEADDPPRVDSEIEEAESQESSVEDSWSLHKISMLSLKSSVGAFLVFGCLVTVGAMFVDQGILIEFLAKSAICQLFPVRLQGLYVTSHDIALEMLMSMTDYFPIYRTPPRSAFRSVAAFLYNSFWFMAKIPFLD